MAHEAFPYWTKDDLLPGTDKKSILDLEDKIQEASAY